MLSEATEADTQLGMQWIARGVQAPATVTDAAPAAAAPTPPAWAQQQATSTDVPF
jgi:hypothetical protein